MIYGCNEAGVEALQGMANAITAAAEEILSHAQQLKAAGEGENLGPHAESVVAAGETIEAAINAASEPIEDIAASLNAVAEGYEDVIANDRIKSAAGN